MDMKPCALWLGLVLFGAGNIRADEPPTIPIGLDAYRQWDHWADQRIGARAYMRSTYDRTGGNENADASHFLYQTADDFNVSLDVEGPGVLYFVRTNHWHGSPWHYVVDGSDHIVQETSTADPTKPAPQSVFLPANLFPPWLTFTWDTTKGADLMWVPIPFEKSFQMAYSRTHYGTGYYIYDQYVRGIPLSQPIHAWDGVTPPEADVPALLARSGTDLVPQPDSPEGKKLGLLEKTNKTPLSLGPNGTFSMELPAKAHPMLMRALDLSVPRAQAVDFGRARIRITWDHRTAPSIDAPLALFFGAGTLYNRDGREYLVKAFPMTIRFDADRVYLSCYFPMPFAHAAQIELIGNGQTPITDLRERIRYQPLNEPMNHVGYFHATYRDHPVIPPRGHDLEFLDTDGIEGQHDWSGQFVGTSFIFSDRAALGTLEGDPRFFFDDSNTPQAQGTGTEEWGGGGDYWGGKNMTLPLAGHPLGATDVKKALTDDDKIESAYRFLLADMMPFGKRAVITFEHGGEDDSEEHYQSVTYWYGLPGASLIKTDELKVGDTASEHAHRYISPDASAPYDITSRYELGVDTISAKPDPTAPQPQPRIEVFPATTDTGRKTTGTSEFSLKLQTDNLGVLLRRKLDYAFPNQRAEVSIADETAGQPLTWKPAGTWYLAGSNTCVSSCPKGELDPVEHKIETSNRRFRDDEFLVPRDLTQGRSAIRVRVKFTPVAHPLFPGQPLPELAWSEIRYDAYCFVMPKFESDAK
jgi:hypothetical protein